MNLFSRSPQPPPPPEGNPAIAAAADRFSIVELRKLHQQLVENKSVSEENSGLVVEILRVISEMVVYGDNKSELLFDYFCEKNMLPLFLELMHSEHGCPSSVHIQILQTLSILINCVRNDTSLYYLLSNNHVNDIISYEHDFENDEGLRDQFVAFMKSVSLKLNTQTIQFFFIEETGTFPLLAKAVDLLRINEPMVRIASQSTILNVYKVEDVRSREYALREEVMHKFFSELVSIMKDQLASVSKTCNSYFTASKELDAEAVQGKLELTLEDSMAGVEDWFYYLQDIMDLGILKLKSAVITTLVSEFFLPEILQPIVRLQGMQQRNAHDSSATSGSGGGGAKSIDAELETINVMSCLSYLLQMLRIVNDPLMHRAIFIVLYHPLSWKSIQNFTSCHLHFPRPSLAVSSYHDAVGYESTSLVLGDLHGPNESWDKLREIPGDESGDKDGFRHETNPVRAALNYVMLHDHQKVTLLVVYILHLLTNNLVVGTPGTDPSPNLSSNKPFVPIVHIGSTLQTIRFLQMLNTLPVLEGEADETGEFDTSRDEDDESAKVSPEKPTEELVAVPIWKQSKHRSRDKFNRLVFSADAEEEVTPAMAMLSMDLLASAEKTMRRVKGQVSLEAASPLRTATGSVTDTAAASASSLVEVYCSMLEYPHSHCLTVLQVVTHSLFAFGCALQAAHLELNSKTTTRNSIAPAPVVSLIGPEISDKALCGNNSENLAEMAADAAAAAGAAPLIRQCSFGAQEKAETSIALGLQRIVAGVRAAGRNAALSLREKMEGPFSETLLNSINEEIQRYQGSKWKIAITRMYRDILLMLPSTPATVERAGLDFDIPISRAEIIRKDIHSFLLVRALFTHVDSFGSTDGGMDRGVATSAVAMSSSSGGGATISLDKLCSSIRDKEFLCLDEANIIPPTHASGVSFDMRGKRFLDCAVTQPVASGENGGELSGGGRTPENTSGGGWTASLMSTLKRQSLSPNGSTRSPSQEKKRGKSIISLSKDSSQSPSRKDKKNLANAPSTNGNDPNVKKESVLFLQDPNVLILIQQHRIEGSKQAGFKVYAVSSLLYTDAQADRGDKKSFNILVRSWGDKEHMRRVGADVDLGSGTIASTGKAQMSVKSFAQKNTNCFLNAGSKSDMWQLKVTMETEQACSLAVMHIENKRKDIHKAKMSRLRSILDKWASDSDFISPHE